MATRMCGRAGEPAVRKGPWTLEEDLILVSYISQNGEGSWDNLARSAGELSYTLDVTFLLRCWKLLGFDRSEL
jgi:hypothetical protein